MSHQLLPNFLPLLAIGYWLLAIFTIGCGQNYLKSGLKYLEASDYNKAEAEFKKAIAKEPNDAKGYVNLGMVHIKQGRISEAISMFETSVEIDQSSADAYNNLAFAYAEKNLKLDSALYLAQNAAKLRPDDPKILDTLAWVYYKKGMYQEALEAVNDAIAGEPSRPLFQEHQKLILGKINQLREVWVRLGVENIERGLKLLDIEPDGKTTSDSNEGLECRKTDVKNGQTSFYLTLSEPPAKKVEELRIKVEYLSSSASPILLYGFNKEAVRVDINKINKTNQLDEDEIYWREASFTITEVDFSAISPDQAAFKIVNTSSEQDICIRFVDVIWVEGEKEE
jgi:Tfp pilus assembly protein PilF